MKTFPREKDKPKPAVEIQAFYRKDPQARRNGLSNQA
jgi:hypothetical protein